MVSVPPLVIDVKNLTKAFDGKVVVNNINLQVKKGEIHGFLGPNGSGKTTTIRMICGLLKPTSGSGTCLGYDIITQSRDIKLKVGYMTQRFSLYEDLSVYENLDFIARVYQLDNRKARVAKSIDRLGISRQRQKQLAGHLSGGWKQRLALAAAIIHDPDLLLLDEPTGGVDPKARRDFWDQIHLLSAEGITTLVSTHYMDEAERCHRLAYIAYGNLLVDDTASEVIKKSNLTTWQVSGPGLNALSIKLRQEPAIDQVAVFGQRLHVSGKETDAFAKTIVRFKDKKNTWQKIATSLEDVFIHFMNNEKDNFT